MIKSIRSVQNYETNTNSPAQWLTCIRIMAVTLLWTLGFKWNIKIWKLPSNRHSTVIPILPIFFIQHIFFHLESTLGRTSIASICLHLNWSKFRFITRPKADSSNISKNSVGNVKRQTNNSGHIERPLWSTHIFVSICQRVNSVVDFVGLRPH